MSNLFGVPFKGAEFSGDKTMRYSLHRIWDQSKPLVMFVGLNPSTANANTDDPTIRRCRQIATNLGYGGFYMCNCFPFISTDPKRVPSGVNVIAYWENERTLIEKGALCKDVIFAWGNFEIVVKHKQDKALAKLFPHAKALFINKNGSPKHPLYCRIDTIPVPYQPTDATTP